MLPIILTIVTLYLIQLVIVVSFLIGDINRSEHHRAFMTRRAFWIQTIPLAWLIICIYMTFAEIRDQYRSLPPK